MCLTILFRRKLDLCVLNITLFLDRFNMTLLFTVALTLFTPFWELPDWTAIGVHTEMKVAFLPTELCLPLLSLTSR